jgi:hypothetical protein
MTLQCFASVLHLVVLLHTTVQTADLREAQAMKQCPRCSVVCQYRTASCTLIQCQCTGTGRLSPHTDVVTQDFAAGAVVLQVGANGGALQQ